MTWTILETSFPNSEAAAEERVSAVLSPSVAPGTTELLCQAKNPIPLLLTDLCIILVVWSKIHKIDLTSRLLQESEGALAF